MKLEEIKELMKAMEENDIASFEFNEGGVHLSLRRGYEPEGSMTGACAGAAVPGNRPQAGASAQTAVSDGAGQAALSGDAQAAPKAASASSGASEQKEEGKLVTSPLVGTFYAADAPEKEAFVKVGDSVKKGQVLGIIEAMKLMNEIESEFDGVVEEVLVKNEEVVEYGQPLFRIR